LRVPRLNDSLRKSQFIKNEKNTHTTKNVPRNKIEYFNSKNMGLHF